MSAPSCHVDGCAKPVKSRGWCQMHYFRWRRHGDPNALMIEPWTDEEMEMIRRTRNLTAKEVMRHLDRSWNCIRDMRAQLAHDEGISFEKLPHANDPNCVGNRRLIAKTCLGCGLLLEAKWFTETKSGARWTSRCTRCSTSVPCKKEYNRKYRTENRAQVQDWARKQREVMQALTRPRASRHGFPWLDEDHNVLRDSTLTVFEKAIQLGRTYAATATAITANGYTSRVGKGDPVEGAWHINNPNEAKVPA